MNQLSWDFSGRPLANFIPELREVFQTFPMITYVKFTQRTIPPYQDFSEQDDYFINFGGNLDLVDRETGMKLLEYGRKFSRILIKYGTELKNVFGTGVNLEAKLLNNRVMFEIQD